MTWTNLSISKETQLSHYKKKQSAKAKGNEFEKEVAKTFSTNGKPAKCSFQGGAGGGLGQPDVNVLPGWHCEAKNTERLNIPDWIRQLEEDCPKDKKKMLTFKHAGKPWMAIELSNVDHLVADRAEQMGIEIS